MNFIPKAIRPRFEKSAQANSEMITHDIFIQLEWSCAVKHRVKK